MTRDESMLELGAWLRTAPGRYLLAWEQERLDHAVTDAFGFHALQLGLPELEGLRANRMPHRWVASDSMHVPDDLSLELPPLDDSLLSTQALHEPIGLHCEFDALPFPDNSIDLVVLPHALELARDPHHTLREVERVLVPEGRVVIAGFNPASLWGLRQRAGRIGHGLGIQRQDGLYLPRAGEFIGYWRLRDWLRLLGFGRAFRLLAPALPKPEVAGPFRLDGPPRRPLVARAGQRVFCGGRQARARHAPGGHGQAGKAQGPCSDGGFGAPRARPAGHRVDPG